MKDNKRFILIGGAMLIFFGLAIAREYNACDGRLVRGLFWLECIKNKGET